MKEKQNNIKGYGVIIGILSLAAQHGIYLLANLLAGIVGVTPFLPKISIDYLIPIVPAFIVPYVWAYAFWAMAPMAASKCEKEHFKDFCAAYLLSCLVGAVILVFAPTYMDRVAEGLTDTSRTGFGAGLMRFWYTLDGGDMAYNLFPSFHCINSTISYLAVAKRPEIPKWFRVYSLVTAILIYASTVFVKQHFILDVFSGIIIAVVVFAVCKKKHLGRMFNPVERFFANLKKDKKTA